MRRASLTLFAVVLACKAPTTSTSKATTAESTTSNATTSQPTTSEVAPLVLPAAPRLLPVLFTPDDSGLTLKGPIPLANGRVAMQKDDRYAALAYGRAALGLEGLIVTLTDAPAPCGYMPNPPNFSISLRLSPGPDGDFFAGKIVTTTVEFTTRGFGHLKLDRFELAEGKHVIGQLSYSDPGSGGRNGAIINPSRGAGRFDVVVCPVSATDKAALRPPPELTATAPLAFATGVESGAPKTVLVTVEYDGHDGQPYVSGLAAYDQAGVTCESPYVTHGVQMNLELGLVASDLGNAQPALFDPDGLHQSPVSRRSPIAWINLDPFGLATGPTVKGSVLAFANSYDSDPRATTPVHVPPASLTGTFEARVCRRGSKFGKPYL